MTMPTIECAAVPPEVMEYIGNIVAPHMQSISDEIDAAFPAYPGAMRVIAMALMLGIFLKTEDASTACNSLNKLLVRFGYKLVGKAN